jgi:uncharacterized protein YciI
MKHFIIDITYTAPAERIDEVRPAHRTFLQGGYEKGLLLCSGPRTGIAPGGMVVARAPSIEEIKEFFANDPYYTQEVASHAFIEFDPLLRQSFLDDWVAGAGFSA